MVLITWYQYINASHCLGVERRIADDVLRREFLNDARVNQVVAVLKLDDEIDALTYDLEGRHVIPVRGIHFPWGGISCLA